MEESNLPDTDFKSNGYKNAWKFSEKLNKREQA